MTTNTDKLKVWATHHSDRGSAYAREMGMRRANGSYQPTSIVAAPSAKAAAEALGMSVSRLHTWASITGNKHEIALATSKPGTVFITNAIAINEDTEWMEVPHVAS